MDSNYNDSDLIENLPHANLQEHTSPLKHLTNHVRDHYNVHDVTKIYPGEIKVFGFKIPFEVRLGVKPGRITPLTPEDAQSLEIRSQIHATQRAKTNISDIVKCNDFTEFVTLTFDPKKVKSRYDVSVLKLKTHRWLESQRKKYGKFDYLIVAEKHKDGAIHFHALFQGYKGLLSDSGVKHDGRTVYNLPGWSYGHSTAKTIKQDSESKQRVSAYVSKYISKDMVTFAGKKRYWVSQGLNRPEKRINHRHENPTSEIYWATRRIGDAYENKHCTIESFTTVKPPDSQQNAP